MAETERSKLQESIDAGWIDETLARSLAPTEAALDEAEEAYRAVMTKVIRECGHNTEAKVGLRQVFELLGALNNLHSARIDFWIGASLAQSRTWSARELAAALGADGVSFEKWVPPGLVDSESSRDAGEEPTDGPSPS